MPQQPLTIVKSEPLAQPAPSPSQAPPPAAHFEDALPATLATGASFLTAKLPVLSVGTAAMGGAMGEGLRRTIKLIRDPVPEGPGWDAFQRLTGEAADIPGAMAREAAIQGGAEAAGGVVTKGVSALGTAVYRGYLKPSLSMLDLPKAREVVATGIREMLPITKAGEERAKRLIRDINNQVTAMLSSARGKVDLHAVAERVRKFAQNKYFKPGVDQSDYNAAMEVADLLDNHPALGLPAGVKPSRVEVSAPQANEIKQAVRPNSRAYGAQGADAEATARKTAGHEMRAALEAVEPRIANLNDRERKLIDALDAVTKASGREENRSALFGVPTLVAGAVAGQNYSSDGDAAQALIAGLTARGLLSSAVASRAAILAAKFARVPGTGAALAARMAAILALRESEEQE
jgi:hypothetical protein